MNAMDGLESGDHESGDPLAERANKTFHRVLWPLRVSGTQK